MQPTSYALTSTRTGHTLQKVRRAGSYAALPSSVVIIVAVTGCQSPPNFKPWQAAGTVAHAMNPARLWSGESRVAESADDVVLREKLQSENWEERLQAIGEVSRKDPASAGEWTAQMEELAEDGNSSVSAAAKSWLQSRGTKTSQPAGYADKIASVTKYGEIGSDKARQTITASGKASSDTIQQATHNAWDALGKKTGLSNVMNDPSWKERAQVAKMLVNEQTAAGLDRGLQLLQDPSVEVQLQTVRSASAWPLQLAGPLWLSALDSKSPQVQREAAALLAKNWKPAQEVFPANDASPLAALADASSPNHASIRTQVDVLKSRWDRDFGANLGSAAKKGIEYAQTQFSEEQIAAAQKLLDTWQNSQLPEFVRQQAAQKLRLFGDQLPDMLHMVAQRTGVPLSETVYRDLLAQASPVFGSLQQLADGTPAAKRLAITNLSKQVANRYLSDAELARLSGVVQGQQDPEIWSNVLNMIGSDKRDAALGIASAASLAPNETVRNQALAILSASGDPRFSSLVNTTTK